MDKADRELTAFCPNYTKAIEIIGRRWSGAIIRAMLAGARRFGDIRASIPDLSDRLLSDRLKELEAEGIIRRTVQPSTPVRIEYRLTDKGEALGDVVNAVGDWADRWVTPDEAPRRRSSATAPDRAPQRTSNR